MKTDYFSVSEQLNQLNPYLVECARATLSPEWRMELQSAPYSRLYYFTAGEAWVESGGVRQIMEAGRFYLIPAGLPFRAGCEASAEKLYFHLNLLKRDGYDLAMELGEIASHTVSPARIAELERLCRGKDYRSMLQLKNLLMEDVLEVFAHSGAAGDEAAAYSRGVQQTVNYIRRNLSARLSVRELAERLYLSERTLNNAFHRELGKTVGQYLDEMLLFEAQRRLLLTDASIGEISEALGYCDQFYFSRRFKTHCGKTPTAYRKDAKT